MVTLQLRGAAIATTYTDGEGRFSFNSVAGSLYHVVINDERYMPVDVEVFVRPDVLSMNMLQLTLVVRGSKPTQGTTGSDGYVVSAADLAKTYPKKAVKEFRHGLKLESEGKPEEAIQHYQKAIKEAPDFAVAHNNLGSVYLSKSQFPEARRSSRKAFGLAPSDSKGYFNMGQSDATARARWRKHDDIFKTVREDDLIPPLVCLCRGAGLEAGKLPEAERALRRALEWNPKMTQPRLELVAIYLWRTTTGGRDLRIAEILAGSAALTLGTQGSRGVDKLQGGRKPSPETVAYDFSLRAYWRRGDR